MLRGKTLLGYSAFVAALGGFLFGFDTAVISGAEKSIQELWELTGFWHGFTVAIALIGTVIGALVAAKPADSFGRKKVLLIIAILYFISAVGSAFANEWLLFIAFRFIGGVGVGASSVVGPMYIAEIAPAKKRGRLVALFQMNVVLGILIAFISNYLISINVEINAWRWMLGIEAIPAILFLFLLIPVPGTPRWLVLKGKVEKAKEVLTRFGESDVEREIKEIQEALEAEKGISRVKLFTGHHSFPVMLAILIAVFNQFSGINAIMYYAPRIFEIAGLDRTSALFQSVSIGLTNMIFTIAAMFVIDKLGRKKLLLIGSIGMFVTLMIVAVSFLAEIGGLVVLIGLVGFIAFFAASQGAVIWVFISEIFPTNVRAKGQTLGSFTHWILAALISWIFPIVTNGNPINTGIAFIFFSLAMLAQFFVVGRIFPETKGKSLEELQKELVSK